MSVTVAVDAMGGDAAPGVVVEGAVAAARSGTVRVALVGPEEVVKAELARHDTAGLPLEVVHAPDVIEMGESPVLAVRGKPGSSVHVGLGLHRSGQAEALVSAGNTGAVMAASIFVLGRAPGVARPTLPGIYPTVKGRCLLLDVGSNVDCRPEHLVQFARMGAVYASRVMGISDPTVGLLNIGEEPGKGNEQAKIAYELLAVA
ncbi:MAG TPA: phosphate acyltransferase, partial [Rhodothermales bacterium]|nr:phosphate acyltransferase [Rhodothermales bacterium]